MQETTHAFGLAQKTTDAFGLRYPEYQYLTIRLDKEMKRWLGQQADKQFSNMSSIVKQGIKLLMEKVEREEKK